MQLALKAPKKAHFSRRRIFQEGALFHGAETAAPDNLLQLAAAGVEWSGVEWSVVKW